MEVNHIFSFQMSIFWYQQNLIMFELFLTPYLKSGISYLSEDISFVFVAPIVLEI